MKVDIPFFILGDHPFLFTILLLLEKNPSTLPQFKLKLIGLIPLNRLIESKDS